MVIKEAKFIVSNTDVNKCPASELPEYAFVGRSNVGKSSLINMLTGTKGLAKISVRPGKTQLINHFLINKQWYLADLPGYGYAKVSKKKRGSWLKLITNYILVRKNLFCVFVLIDSRLEPQENDLEFIDFLGKHEVPFVIAFTKADKLSKGRLKSNTGNFLSAMAQNWTELPQYFITSAKKQQGRDEILQFIEQTNSL